MGKFRIRKKMVQVCDDFKVGIAIYKEGKIFEG